MDKHGNFEPLPRAQNGYSNYFGQVVNISLLGSSALFGILSVVTQYRKSWNWFFEGHEENNTALIFTSCDMKEHQDEDIGLS